mmetsp:Transcript_14951/g.28943  ORF Transcript_14951/g.28943 Transcript_14951/m.28943 type:complete len:286 (+) Transcript_14951:140-997(+)
MGERKVLNKYYPPDFDPSKLQRQRKGENDKQIKVRMMLPFSLRCGTCGNFIYKGTKFNSRKEDVENETYLGIRIYRFYFRCPRCAAEIAMKTDPKNSDYVCELGATRNFEPHREQSRQEEGMKRKREEEEEGDAMRALENKTLDSKREMEELEELEERRSMTNRWRKLDTGKVIAALKGPKGEKSAGEDCLNEEDEAELEELRLFRAKNIKRIADREEKSVDALASEKLDKRGNESVKPKKKAIAVKFAVRLKQIETTNNKAKDSEEAKPAGLAGLMAYDSSSED